MVQRPFLSRLTRYDEINFNGSQKGTNVTVIKEVWGALRQGTFVATETRLRAIKKFVSNSQHRTSRMEIVELLTLIASHEWPLEPFFDAVSVAWIRDLLFRKDGTQRDTHEARKFSASEADIVRYCTHFTLKGIHHEVQRYDTHRHPGFERATDVYPVFVLYSKSHCLEFLYRPWQANVDPRKTGFVLLSSGRIQE